MSESNELQLRPAGSAAMTGETARVIQEVQGAIIVAQHCPRNEQKAFTEIINACKRQTLAEQSAYSFPRGGQTITGPSIRLAEVIARHWGNLQYGIREVESNSNETKFEAYCWDVQTNTRASRIFTQKHGRWTKKSGFKAVDDPRDVYEVVASSASRRLRACILEIVPGDIVDEALAQCRKTLAGSSDKPLKDRIRSMILNFQNNHSVTEEMIAKRLGHKVDVISEHELVDLRGIYKSLQDGMSKREDWFDFGDDPATNDLNDRFNDPKPEETKKAEGEPRDVTPEEKPKSDPKKKADKKGGVSAGNNSEGK